MTQIWENIWENYLGKDMGNYMGNGMGNGMGKRRVVGGRDPDPDKNPWHSSLPLFVNPHRNI